MTPPPAGAGQRRLLRIYLNDHLTGAMLGVRLARRCQSSNRGEPLGAFLEELVAELEEDRATLEELMVALRLSRDPVKPTAAAIAEFVGRAKLNGSLTRYSDLSRLEELEGLTAGVTLKLRLWKALHRAAPAHPALEGVDFDRLVARASSQLERLEAHRLEAAARALA